MGLRKVVKEAKTAVKAIKETEKGKLQLKPLISDNTTKRSK